MGYIPRLRPRSISTQVALTTLTFSLASLCFALFCISRIDKPSCRSTSPSQNIEFRTVADKPLKRIVFITNGDDPFWDALRKGLQEGDRELKIADQGLTAVMEVNDGTPQGQINKLRQMNSQPDIAAVAISVINASNASIAGEMSKLKAKGIPVITVDSDIDRVKYRSSRSFYIGTDNLVAGRVLGKAGATILEKRGKKSGAYVQFAGFTDVDNARARMDGVKEALGAGFIEKDRMSDEMDLSRARDNVRNAISNHRKDLVALVGIWAYNAPAIAQIVDQNKLRDSIAVVTFDAQAEAIADMEKGRIDAMVVQNPFSMGVLTVKLLSAMVRKDDSVAKEMFPKLGQPDGDIYTTGLRLVVPDQGSPITADQHDPKVVEFMKLTDFKAWLAKFGLKSS
jgi:ribose transport system substrate-binding protein